MRWITFLILLYLMTALQVAKLGAFPSGPQGDYFWPEILYLPLLAVFYALFAADAAAPLAGLACGLMMDLFNHDYMGTYAVPLAVVCWLVVRIRLSIFREHMISQLIMTLLSVLAFSILSVIYRRMIGAPLEGHNVWTHLGKLSADAVYTSVAAPILFWVFFRFNHLLGFTSHGPRARK